MGVGGRDRQTETENLGTYGSRWARETGTESGQTGDRDRQTDRQRQRISVYMEAVGLERQGQTESGQTGERERQTDRQTERTRLELETFIFQGL